MIGRLRFLAGALLVLFAGVAPHGACREPTYVTLRVETDVPCQDLKGTTITLGSFKELEGRAPLTTVTSCSPDGQIGSLVVTPSGSDTEEFAVRVVSGLKRNVEECKPPSYGEGCIVARRVLRFVANEPLTLPIAMRASCAGNACGPEQTCVKGVCVDARIDSTKCVGAGCSEDVLAGDGQGDAGPPLVSGCNGLGIDFTPSNVDPKALTFPATASLSIDAPCTVNGVDGRFTCNPNVGSAYAYQRVATPAGDVAVFSVCDLRLQAAATLEVRGSLPIVIVALGTVDLFGSFAAGSTSSEGFGGGPSSIAESTGGGQGGGTYASTGGSGGGGYCGPGGTGGQSSGPQTPGGMPYGTPEIVPLIAGSAGAAFFDRTGGGGGALQIVAGKRVTLGPTARIHASGGGGSRYSGGGGSGGSILIEAPTVEVAGVLAANGGAGGGGFEGESRDGRPGQPSDQPASPGSPGTGTAGGPGSAGAVIEGGAGLRTSGAGGGGGGGAGRIRINSRTPPTITGIISPATSTPCATLGPLR